MVNKLYDYMMDEKTIIYSIASRNKEVKETGCGWITEPENVSMLAKTIIKAYSTDKGRLKELGLRGRKWVLDNCEYKILAEKFISITQ